MLARSPWLLAFALTASCIRDDPNHCANQSENGDAYCDAKHDLPYCSSCNAKLDGCVMAANASAIDPDCRPSNVTAVADDDGSTADPTSVSMSMSDSIADDSATSVSADTTTEPTTADDGSSGDTTGPPPAVCDNGILEQGEVCDGTDLNGLNCMSTQHEGGTLACDSETCEYDFTDCDSQNPVCGDGVVNQGPEFEVCDGEDFDEQTCDNQPGHGPQGDLACTDDCKIDASACCLSANEECTANAQCCSSLCGLLGDGPECLLGG